MVASRVSYEKGELHEECWAQDDRTQALTFQLVSDWASS